MKYKSMEDLRKFTMKQNKKWNFGGERKLKKGSLPVLMVVLLFIAYSMGIQSGEIVAEGKVKDVATLNDEIKALSTEYENLEEKAGTEKSELEALQVEKEEALSLIASKESVEKEIAEAEGQLADSRAALEKELTDGQKEVEDQLAVLKKEQDTKLAEHDKELEAKRTEVEKEKAKADQELKDKRESIATQIKEVDADLLTAQGQVKSLDADIAAKQVELENIGVAIKKKAQEPISLNSGQYIVGKDIPIGRYQATNVGRGSNFVVYSSSGSLEVNTILGNGRVGSGDYVFFATEGALIESDGKIKLIPVE